MTLLFNSKRTLKRFMGEFLVMFHYGATMWLFPHVEMATRIMMMMMASRTYSRLLEKRGPPMQALQD